MSQIRQLQIIGHFEHPNLSDFIKTSIKRTCQINLCLDAKIECFWNNIFKHRWLYLKQLK